MKIMLYLLSLELLHIFVFIATAEITFFKKIKTAFNMIKRLEWNSFFVALLNNPKMIICSLSIFIFFVVGVIAWILIKYKINIDHEDPKRIFKIKDKYDQLSFISTYVVPLIAFSYDNWNQVLLYVVYLISLGIIYMKTGQYSMNPTLLIWGFQLYNIELEKGEEYTVISREKFKDDDNIKYVHLDKKNKILIGKKNK